MDNKQERAVAWSYGGGVQSVAMLVLIARELLPRPDIIVMADTGRERSLTWKYTIEHALPIFDKLGMKLEIAGHELATVDLYGKNGDLLLPVFTAHGKMPTLCSTEWKQRVARRYLRDRGYGPDNPVTMWFGMSLDEVHRMRVSDVNWIQNYYPLCFDVKLRRHECIERVLQYGLPKPPKSACWMCPNMDKSEWIEEKELSPEDFEKAVALDHDIRERDPQHALYLYEDAVPLDDVDWSSPPKPRDMFDLCANACWT